MFRDDRQICDAVRVLLSSLRLEHLWTESGPTEQALRLFEDERGAMSHGEALLLLAAFDFWNGHGKVDLGEPLAVLDSDRLKLAASLMIAASEGSRAVDRWIAEHGRAPQRGAQPGAARGDREKALSRSTSSAPCSRQSQCRRLPPRG